MEELVFDAEPKQVPVTVKGKKYVLRQANGTAGNAYRNAMMRSMRMGADGMAEGLDGVADAETVLLSRCLYAANPDGSLPLNKNGDPDPRSLVSQETILAWDDVVQTRLAEVAKDISGLGKRKAAPAANGEAEKNSHAACTVGSP